MTISREAEETTALGNPVTVRLELKNRPGTLGRTTSAIGQAGGNIGAIDIVTMRSDTVVRDLTFNTATEREAQAVLRSLRKVDGVRVRSVSDPILLAHLRGKLEVRSRVPLRTRRDLSIAYTPGVGEVCREISRSPQSVWNLTVKQNSVAVVTDGSAVLGLGDIGPEAAMPVMEGKVLLFKEFADIDGWPLCLDTKDPDAIVDTVARASPAFGGINLEDIAAPRCFDVEERLKEQLDIPVFHDDQHGTAVVVMGALLNALRITGKRFEELKVVILGVGAAGVACARILMSQGTRKILGCDRAGIVYQGRRENMNPTKEWFAEHTNPDNVRGTVSDAMVDADVFLGLSGPGLIERNDITRMAPEPIVFAMANPVPEIMPEEMQGIVRVVATGRSDYPNQINNVLCFPGLFRGALDVRAREINEEMKMAAARAIAHSIRPRELQEDYIVPSVFNRAVVPSVAKAVAQAARRTGVARRGRRSTRRA